MSERQAEVGVIASVVSAIFLLLALPGCGPSNSGDAMIAAANKTNVHRLCNMYNYYQAKNGWGGPPNLEAFRKFIDEQPDRVLDRMGIRPGDIESLFVSERDNEPFEIRYAVAGSSRGSDEPIVFEKVGVRGKRMVGFTSSRHREVEAAEYEALFKSE